MAPNGSVREITRRVERYLAEQAEPVTRFIVRWDEEGVELPPVPPGVKHYVIRWPEDELNGGDEPTAVDAGEEA